MENWNELHFWQTGEWQVIEEKLKSTVYCPGKDKLFASLKATPIDKVKVVFVGQDPYPNPKDAIGIAFAIPNGNTITPTLSNIFKEYQEDLHYPSPSSSSYCLNKWVTEGILLLNAIPSCSPYKSLSHDWVEYVFLTEEILDTLKGRNVVFVFFGGVSQRYADKVEKEGEAVIRVSHPSPRASLRALNPFAGSRIFTRINSILASKGVSPIDWRLE